MEIQWISYLIYIFFNDLIVGGWFEPMMFLLKTTKCVNWVVRLLVFFLIIILVRILNTTTYSSKCMSIWSNNYIDALCSHIYGGIYHECERMEYHFFFFYFILYKIEILLYHNLSVYVCETPSWRLEPRPLPPHTWQALILVEWPSHQRYTVVEYHLICSLNT